MCRIGRLLIGALHKKSGPFSLIVPDERVSGPESHSYPWVAFFASFLAIKKEEDT